MRTTLQTALTFFLACAFIAAAPALAQEPEGDAPDGVGAAQNADGLPVIFGDLETEEDVDCFAIFIEDPFVFSASTLGSPPDIAPDTKLYLFEGTPTGGATTGEVENDDAPVGGTLLSEIPVGALPGPNDAGPGKYVICVTSFDTDPQNSVPEDIFPGGSPFNAVNYPNAPSGDFNLASWDFPGFGSAGPYQIDLTGIGVNPGECVLKLKSDIMVNPNPVEPGNNVQVTGRIGNNGTQRTRASLTIFYNRKVDGQPGPPMGSLRFEGNVPPGNFPFKIRVRVVAGAPRGLYNLRFVLEDKDAEQTCGTFESQLQIGATLAAEEPTSVESERFATQTKGDVSLTRVRPALSAVSTALDLDDLAVAEATATAQAVGVSPNPFLGRTTLSFDVAETTDVRLAVYDILGRQVEVLVDARVEPGTHEAVFDARGLAAGTYVYHLMVGSEVQTGRITLAR